MIYSGKLHILRPHNVPGEVATILDIDGEVTCAMQDQRGHSDCRKHVSNIDGVRRQVFRPCRIGRAAEKPGERFDVVDIVVLRLLAEPAYSDVLEHAAAKIEHVVPEHNVPHFSKLFDIHMMCWGTGQERTEPRYVRLLEKAGWQPTSSYYPANRHMGIITGVCA